MTFVKTLIACGIASIVSVESMAEDASPSEQTFYIGGGYGQYSIKWDNDETDFDEDAEVLKAYGGVSFNKFLGAELAYLNFDEANDFDSNADIQGVSLAGIVSLPLHDRVSLYAKGGWFQWSADLKTILPVVGEVSESTDGGDWFYGAGVKLNITQHLNLRFEYERYELDEDIKPELDVASANIQFSF